MNNGNMPVHGHMREPTDGEYQKYLVRGLTSSPPAVWVPGMTKREAFAMAAMQGLLSSWGEHDVSSFFEIASDSLNAADALLQALEDKK